MVDLTRDKGGNVQARLLDLVLGRSGEADKTWLRDRGDAFRKCVEVAALDPFHTLNQWKDQFRGYFTTGGANNGGTKAINGLIELARRVALGFRNPDNYRLRILLIGGGLRLCPTLKSEEPLTFDSAKNTTNPSQDGALRPVS